MTNQHYDKRYDIPFVFYEINQDDLRLYFVSKRLKKIEKEYQNCSI